MAGLPSNYVSISEKTFDDLENFIIMHKTDSGTEALEFMSISSKKGIGKVISAKNYVGLIQMNDGTQIEILPKIYTKEKIESERVTRKIFLKMLSSLKDFPFKTFNNSNLGVSRTSLFEIFIKMFIDEIRALTKRGLSSNYIPHEENEKFYKGKLIFNEQIKKNFIHKECFFVSYDVFSVNRPENKLVKATLMKLLKLSKDSRNIRDIEQLLVAFEVVDVSVNYSQDFSKIKMDRSMQAYELLLAWCKVFLMNKSFTTFAGSSIAYALLFPMEKVFEAYMGNVMKKYFGAKDKVTLQDQKYHLFDQPKQFKLQPDIVLQMTDSIIIMDAKWKLLNSLYPNYGISQTDMYQMYAYSKKYNARKIYLLYPLHEDVSDQMHAELSFISNDQVMIEVIFIDLQNIVSTIERISASMS
ncbi:mcrBC 5-methylcytosine restriction system component [Paenibacillus sp. CCS19]|nr:mcrBC 5-methylcytosine restriction system component [Paenibacillus cellulosilyticus]